MSHMQRPSSPRKLSSNLTSADLKMFARLGISAELLERARVERVDDRTAREKYGITGHGDMSGIVYPYEDPRTGRRHTCRLRRDNPELEAGKPKKKYIFPYGDRRHLYFVPGCSELLRDADVPIVLLEAENSALALTAWAERMGRKILPAGMGGCWGFRARISKAVNANGERVDELGPLPELLELCSNDRTVYVLLDSNYATNPEVQRARAALVRVVQRKGTNACILDLPVGPGVNGPDDYIAVKGDEAMAVLFDGAADGRRQQPSISLSEPPPFLDPGHYVARCTEATYDWARQYKEWKARLAFAPLNYEGRPYTGRLCKFLGLGKNPQKPYAGRQSHFRRLLAEVNGDEPASANVEMKIFLGALYDIEVVTVTTGADGKPKSPEHFYSIVRDVHLHKCAAPNCCCKASLPGAQSQPVNQPTYQPSNFLTYQPSKPPNSPTHQPTYRATEQLSNRATEQPTNRAANLWLS